ncbi:hypothetical protein IU501_34520 [Nocardia otitidiscaviarum]|uniref:hypothetical protein n=1 Tax=Nocardia otitidiscaviarum TaxID=1823 RepID=UPI001894CF4F|nr:hypothetical protein [Nocardia otitidiscaviarum]MBF6138085.1 hypothetical protein [Nocardia otitidiscaviarum]
MGQLDRIGQPLDETDPYAWPGKKCDNPRCRRPGWIGYDNELRPIPCRICKEHLTKTLITNDFSERIPSYQAQEAIRREGHQ